MSGIIFFAHLKGWKDKIDALFDEIIYKLHHAKNAL